MKFSFGGILGGKKPAHEGPVVVGRSDFGAPFSINMGESAVVENLVVTNMGFDAGRLSVGLKIGERGGRIDLMPSQSGSWFEYKISLVSMEQGFPPKLVVKKLCENAKPVTYDADFWLRAGEAAAFENGLLISNKSVSGSRQGEFTNVLLGLEHNGDRKDVTLVGFAKGREHYVFAQTKKSATFGPFEITLKGASANETTLHVRQSGGLEIM